MVAPLLDLQVFTEEQCPQGSPEWFAARAGVVTASTFATVLASGRGGAPSKTRQTLMYNLAAEILSGRPTPSWEGNQHTKRGHALEPEVRDLYAATCPYDVVQIGFCKRGRIGASPDSFVGDDGLLEIKTKLPALQFEALEAGVLPAEHVAQVQGQLLVTGRQWCDFRSYWPGLPQLKVRVERDTEYMSRLKRELDSFVTELDAVVKKYST